jgi:hypothetical protein
MTATASTPSAGMRRAVLLLVGLLLAVQVSPWYYGQGDAPGYLSIARHVARGDGLLNRASSALWYPPGYSLLISPLFFWGNRPLLAISIVHLLLALGLVYGLYLWAKRFAAEGALWVAAISVSTAAFSAHFRRPVSEVAFMTASIWAMVCLESALAESNRKKSMAYALAATLLFGASGLIRLIGVALAGGIAVRIGLAGVKGRITWPRAAVLALPMILAPVLAVGAIVARDQMVAGSGSYWNATAAHRTVESTKGLAPWLATAVSEIGRVAIPGMNKSYGNVGAWCNVNMLVYLPFALLVVAGWLRWVRRVDDVFAWTLPFYTAILTHFRWESGGRLWLPMTPAMVVCVWFACAPLGRRRQPLFAVVWALHVAAALVFWTARDLPQTRALNARWPEAMSAAASIDRDRDRVTVAEEIEEFGDLVGLELDRRLTVWPKGGPLPPQTQWLIAPDDAAVPQGFAKRARLGNDVLWRHE